MFKYAFEQGRSLVTDDLGFGRLGDFSRQRPPAVILARLDRLSRDARARRVVGAIETLGERSSNHVIVIEPGRIRFRPFDEFDTNG